jgi:hypothetical protein
MPHGSFFFTRRQLLLLAGAAARTAAAAEDFWNIKPPVEWNAGDIYQLLNHSPWAGPAEWWRPNLHPQVTVKAVVTWESARPICDARKVPPATTFANYYVLGVDGIPPGGYSPTYLGRFAVLRSNGKPKWAVKASRARERIRTSSVYEFAFAKAAAPVGPDTEELVFQIEFSGWFLQAKFKPNEMLYHGALAL